MWFFIFFGLAVYYLRQITAWTLPSFRRGIVVYRFQNPFSGKIPNELIGREIICKYIIFKFISPSQGLFRSHPRFLPRSGKTPGFPLLLGEIELDRNDVAQATLRIPLASILIGLTLFLALIISNIGATPTINSVFVGIARDMVALLFLGFFFLIGYFAEKADLQEGVIILKERATDGTLE